MTNSENQISQIVAARIRIAEEAAKKQQDISNKFQDFSLFLKNEVEPQVVAIKQEFLENIPDRLFVVFDEVGTEIDCFPKKEDWLIGDEDPILRYDDEKFVEDFKKNIEKFKESNVLFSISYGFGDFYTSGKGFRVDLRKTNSIYYYSIHAPNAKPNNPLIQGQFDEDKEKSVDAIAERLVLMIDKKEYEAPVSDFRNVDEGPGGY